MDNTTTPPPPNSPIVEDVPFSHWANSYIECLYKAGISGGCSTSSLNCYPDATITRAEMAVFLVRAFSLP